MDVLSAFKEIKAEYLISKNLIEHNQMLLPDAKKQLFNKIKDQLIIEFYGNVRVSESEEADKFRKSGIETFELELVVMSKEQYQNLIETVKSAIYHEIG